MPLFKYQLLVLAFTSMLFACSEPEVNLSSLQTRGEGLKYQVNSERPFTGKAIDKILGSVGGYEYQYEDGLRHGSMVGWHNNGQIFWTATYEKGLRVGRETSWHENGEKWFDRSYLKGKLHGYAVSWNDKGEILAEKNFQNGKLHGLSIDWDGRGNKVSESHYQSGKLVSDR